MQTPERSTSRSTLSNQSTIQISGDSIRYHRALIFAQRAGKADRFLLADDYYDLAVRVSIAVNAHASPGWIHTRIRRTIDLRLYRPVASVMPGFIHTNITIIIVAQVVTVPNTAVDLYVMIWFIRNKLKLSGTSRPKLCPAAAININILFFSLDAQIVDPWGLTGQRRVVGYFWRVLACRTTSWCGVGEKPFRRRACHNKPPLDT